MKYSRNCAIATERILWRYVEGICLCLNTGFAHYHLLSSFGQATPASIPMQAGGGAPSQKESFTYEGLVPLWAHRKHRV